MSHTFTALTARDADAVHRITGHPDVMRHKVDTDGCPWPLTMTAALLADHQVRGVLAPGGQLAAIGWTGLDDWLPALPPTVGINYYTHPDHRGRGYATSLARSLTHPGMVACIVAGNGASAHVAERIGMRLALSGCPYVSPRGTSALFDVWRLDLPAPEGPCP